MEKGQVFTIDRWKDGDVKEFKCIRLCQKWINVRSLDGKDNWAMPYDRLKHINPPQRRFEDNYIELTSNN